MATLSLAVDLAPGHKVGLPLQNPVMTASGTFSNGLEFAAHWDINQLGSIVSKGTTLRPRRGNPQPRTAETPAGMLNSIGLQNIGVEALIRDVAPLWSTWRVPVVVNIAGESAEEFAALAARLDGVSGVAALELNLSCPNIAGGLDFSTDPELTARVVASVARETTLPLLAKLTPNVTDIREVALAAQEAGASALTLINTVLGAQIDVETRRPTLASVFGGLSGPAIRPIALRIVYEVAGVARIPIVGCGGITCGRDAVEFLMAGATTVQVGTATYQNPRAPLEVLDGIVAFMAQHDIHDVRDLIGAARRAP